MKGSIMAKEVKINLDVLDKTVEAYQSAIQNLTDAVNQVNTAIEALRTDQWKTNGADAFFAQYDGSWKNNFENHIEYLTHLFDCLILAKTSYHDEYEAKLQ